MSRVKCLSMSLLLLLLLMYSTARAVEYHVPNCPYDVTTSDIDCDGDFDVIVGSNMSSSVNDTVSAFYNVGGKNFASCYIGNLKFEKI